MNILLFHHYALPPWESGGTRHFLMAKTLVQNGHTVTIIASRYHYATGQSVADMVESVCDGVRFIWINAGGRPKSRIKRAFGMILFAQAALQHANSMKLDGINWDIVFGTSPSLFSAYAASKFAKSNKLKFALEIRDLWPLSLRDIAGWRWWHPGWIVFRHIEKTIYRRADVLFTLLPNAHDWYIESGVKANRIVVVPNGVDGNSAQDPLPLPSRDRNPFVVVYAGAHGLANGLDAVVRAAAQLQENKDAQNIIIRLIGDGPTKPALLELAQKLGATNIEFCDPVAKHDIQGELGRAHCCILHLLRMPTFNYGISPNKLFDYMLAARPVIYCVDAANDPVGEASAGLSVQPEDPQALAQAILELSQLSNDDLSAMGNRGRAYVLTNHNWNILVKRMETSLLKLTKEK